MPRKGQPGAGDVELNQTPNDVDRKRHVNDIEIMRERVRGRLAYGLGTVLGSVVLLGMVGLFFGRFTSGDVKDVFYSLTALVGLAGRFYFPK